MKQGLEPAALEREVGSTTCPLTLCLLACLFDAQACSSGSVAFLHRALSELGHGVEAYDCLPLGGGPQPRVLATCLNYILPELSVRSEDAATQVRYAIAILSSEGSAYPADRYGKLLLHH